MHAAHPFLGIWDDHEVEDNYAGDLPGEAADDRRGVAFMQRRSAATGRSSSGCRSGARSARGHAELHDAAAGPQRRAVPARRAPVPLRPALRRRVLRALPRGREGQPDAARAGPEGVAQERAGALGRVMEGRRQPADDHGARHRDRRPDQQGPVGRLRPSSGARSCQHLADRGIKDVTFITGDIHTFFAGDVGVDGRGPESVATEFVGGSVTSLGIPELVQDASGAPLTPARSTRSPAQLRTTNPHLKYDEQQSRGYGVLTATDDRAARGVQGGQRAAALDARRGRSGRSAWPAAIRACRCSRSSRRAGRSRRSRRRQVGGQPPRGSATPSGSAAVHRE